MNYYHDMKCLWRLFACISIGFLFSCESNKPSEPSDGTYARDSLMITQLFDEALRSLTEADSLIVEGKAIADRHDSLSETYLFYLSRFYIQTGKIAEADSIINTVVERYQNREDNYGLGKFYNLKAAVSAYQHQQEQSVYYYQQAISIFEQFDDTKQLAVVQFNLANTFFSRLDYESSHKYIREAKANFEAIGDATYMPLADGILAVTLTKLDEGEQSKVFAERALSTSEETNNFMGQILAHYALGEYYLYVKKFDIAMGYYEEAQQLSEKFRIPNLNLPLKAASQVALINLERYTEAIAMGQEALAIAQALNNVEIQYNLNRNLAEALAQNGQKALAYQHLQQAEEIFRNNTLANNEETLQKLLIEYETEKKNNLILTQDNNLATQRIYIILLVTLALIGVIGFVSYRRTVGQQRKIEQHNQTLEIVSALTQGEEKERIRLADELHDGIASNLVALRLQLEIGNESKSQAELVALVQRTHQEVRKIAHNLMPIDFGKQEWQYALAAFCREMSNRRTQVVFTPCEHSVRLPQDHALILYRCIQELVQNAVKHAQADRVEVQVLKGHKGMRITVEDNGQGFDVREAERQGLALFKYKDRLQRINTTFDIDSSPGTGTSIFVHYEE